MSKFSDFICVLISSYCAFVLYNLGLDFLAGLVGTIVVLEITIMILFSALFSNDDDSNGGRKKIYPDNKDYSEKTLELMR